MVGHPAGLCFPGYRSGSTKSEGGADLGFVLQASSFAGKVVLDPFMGSGTTLGEALKLGAKAVGCDINPVSTFLVRQSLARVHEDALYQAFNHLKRCVASDIRHYYETRDPLTGEMISV